MRTFNFLFAVTIGFSINSLAFAQDQAGAPSASDSQIFNQNLDDAFGQAVSVEARKLKDATPEQRKVFGKSVAAQRRKNLEHQNENGGRGDGGSDRSEGSAASAVRNAGKAKSHPGVPVRSSNGHGNSGHSN